MLNKIMFFVVILLANIIQGVTGFAGTILAMPPSLMLVGYDTAVPILNLLGLLSGVYVFILNRKEVKWKDLGKILIVMAPMIFAGLALKRYLERFDKAIYITLGILVLVLAITGLLKMFVFNKDQNKYPSDSLPQKILMILLLMAAGTVHGMFVCGGPLLISYLTRKIKDSGAFRATISTVWIVLNGLILGSHIKAGLWTGTTIKTAAVSIPFLLTGMFLGGILYKKMSRKVFMILTYVLLVISGVSLLIK